MVLSNEPGYYVVNQHGIRHENLIAVREAEKQNGILSMNLRR